MKTGVKILWLYFLILTSCNIKEPLENILKEANHATAPLVLHRFNTYTINMKELFPMLSSVDSVRGRGLTSTLLNAESGKWMIHSQDSLRLLHEIEVIKNGRKVSLLSYKIRKQKTEEASLAIKPNSYLNNRLLFRCVTRPEEFYVLWQNVVLPDEFVTFTREGFSVFLPKDVRYMGHSLIRMLAASRGGSIVYVAVPLAYGVPAPVSEWTIQSLNR